MGYTHYWMQTRDFTPQEMGDIAGSLRRIIVEATCDIVGPMGDEGTPPTLTEEEIAFNGRDKNSHETFGFNAKRELPYTGARADQLGIAFCKTARKPYDIVVTACLTLLQADYGFSVWSDGDVDEWEAGVAFAEQALDRAFANPLIVEALLA